MENQAFTINFSRTRNSFYQLIACASAALFLFIGYGSASADNADLSVPFEKLSDPMTLADIRHLASRIGFGVSVEDVKRFAGLTRSQAIDRVVSGFTQNPAVPLPDWVNGSAQKYWNKPDLDQEARRQFNRMRDQEIAMLRQWWVSNMLQTHSPQTERMVLFWHDHFATSYRGLNYHSVLVARQNQLFRELGMGSFETLLKSMIRDPALLMYLDNNQNKKGKPNENLAREFLELFTLGEGNYDEYTVKEAARSLTGYTYASLSDNKFRFNFWNHDEEPKTLFDITDNHDGDSLVDAILAQPAAAEFLTTKFWHALVSDIPANDVTLKSFAHRFRTNNYSIEKLYRDLLSSTAFWHKDNRATIIKSPVSVVVGSARTLEYPKSQWQKMPGMLAKMGMNLFEPPNVSGWSEGAAFIAPGRLLGRYRYLDEIVEQSKAKGRANKKTSSEDMSENMMASEGNMMREDANGVGGGMSEMMMSTADSTDLLQIKLAAENYEGPVEYEVELLKDDEVLWKSGSLILNTGYDTKKFGRIEVESDLPWQTVGFAVGSELLNAATNVIVRFLNDHAGADGDRNLYVNGASLGDVWIDASMAVQDSKCPPSDGSYNGNLYCAGSIDLSREFGNSMIATTRDKARYSASSVHLVWVNDPNSKKGTRQVYLGLSDVVTPSGRYDTLAYALRHEKNGTFAMVIHNYDCTPDCIVDWPECPSNSTDYTETRFVVVLLDQQSEDSRTCEYSRLSDEKKDLVSVLWMSSTDLIAQVQHTSRGKKRAKPLKNWIQLENRINEQLKGSVHARVSDRLLVDESFRVIQPPPKPVLPPPISFSNLSELQSALQGEGLSLEDILLPGLPKQIATTLLNEADWDSLSSFDKLSAITKHPMYQVH